MQPPLERWQEGVVYFRQRENRTDFRHVDHPLEGVVFLGVPNAASITSVEFDGNDAWLNEHDHPYRRVSLVLIEPVRRVDQGGSG